MSRTNIERNEFELPERLQTLLSEPMSISLPPFEQIARRAIALGQPATLASYEFWMYPIAAGLAAIALYQLFSGWWSTVRFQVRIPLSAIAHYYQFSLTSISQVNWLFLLVGGLLGLFLVRASQRSRSL